MQKFYLSFGQASPLSRYLLEVDAPGEIEVRRYAQKNFESLRWCGVYPEAMKEELVTDWAYEIIKANSSSYPTEWFHHSVPPARHAHLDSGEHEV